MTTSATAPSRIRAETLTPDWKVTVTLCPLARSNAGISSCKTSRIAVELRTAISAAFTALPMSTMPSIATAAAILDHMISSLRSCCWSRPIIPTFAVIDTRSVMAGLVPAIHVLLRSREDVDARHKCIARRHPRRVFGDMTDTSSLHTFGCQGGPSMPWQEVSIMDQRREFVRLAMQEGANRRELCRSQYSPRHRLQVAWPLESDRELADRSRRPHSSPLRLIGLSSSVLSLCAIPTLPFYLSISLSVFNSYLSISFIFYLSLYPSPSFLIALPSFCCSHHLFYSFPFCFSIFLSYSPSYFLCHPLPSFLPFSLPLSSFQLIITFPISFFSLYYCLLLLYFPFSSYTLPFFFSLSLSLLPLIAREDALPP